MIDRAVKDLDGIRKQTDITKTARIVRPIVDTLDYLLGETLVAVAYAASMGDAGRGPAAAVDISHRHLFGDDDALSVTPSVLFPGGDRHMGRRPALGTP